MMCSCSTLGCQQHCEQNEESKSRPVIFPLCSTLVRHIQTRSSGPLMTRHTWTYRRQHCRTTKMMKGWSLCHEERLTVLGLFSLDSTILRGILSMCIKCLMGRYKEWRQASRQLKYTKFYLNTRKNSLSYKWPDTATDCSAR